MALIISKNRIASARVSDEIVATGFFSKSKRLIFRICIFYM